MKWRVLLVVLLVHQTVWSQYYLNDCVGLTQSQEKYQLMRKHRIKLIEATSLEADGSATPGFILQQTLPTDGKKMITTIGQQNSPVETITNFYELSKLKKTVVKRLSLETKTEFFYNNKGLLEKLVSTTIDSNQLMPVSETHFWTYGTNGAPTQMLKWGNSIDTLQVHFLSDSTGLVLEEYWMKKGKTIETYYYYYANQRLTDVVRYNQKAKKLLPDFVYEYNDQNQLTQMAQFDGKSMVYWTYTYDQNGLRASETARDKQKNILTKINYRFEKH
jgi:YD repeat-containing protein